MALPHDWGWATTPRIDVTFITGADWAHRVTAPSDQPNPPGTHVYMKIFDDTGDTVLNTIDAVVTEDMYEFRVESEVCDQIPARAKQYVYASFQDEPTLEIPVSYGTVKRK